MAQNKSSAVMQQRQEAKDSLDYFPTPPWSARALVEFVLAGDHQAQTVWEPACNRGYMARPLAEYFGQVWATDVAQYGWAGQQSVHDFLAMGSWSPGPVDWIITNPPFRLAEQFIAQARATARLGCAMLVRTSFLEGVGRYQALFQPHPPTIVAQFVERVPMIRGRVDKKASTATSYAWLVWVKSSQPQPFFWIPPCRKFLERPQDYEAHTTGGGDAVPGIPSR